MRAENTPIPDSASIAPAANWGRQEAGEHVVQFYAEDRAFIDGLARLVGSALGSGDAAIVIATKAHRDALALQLKARGLDTRRASTAGRYHVLDAAETLGKISLKSWPDAALLAEVVGGLIAEAGEASESAGARVVAFGEMVALLWSQRKPEAAIQLEQLWNDLAKTRSFSLHCAYPIAGFGREEDTEPFLKICAEHSHVIPSESYTQLDSEAARLRNISFLQQKAQALEAERATRRDVQKSLRLRESELADILENAIEGVQQVGPDQRILWTNQALLNLLGYSAQEYVGHPLSEFHIHPQTFADFWARLSRKEEVRNFPAELRCKDGSAKQVIINSNALWHDGEFVHTRCFVRDVTEHNQFEQSLRAAEKQAAMGRMAAIIAHEINNPLEAVSNVFYLLRDHPSLDSDARELARIANDEMARMRHIAKQTLAFYRDAEKPVPVSLRLILEDVIGAFHRQIQSSRVTVVRKIKTDGMVLAFPVEVRQILVNLVANALHAMPDGGVLRIHLRNRSQGREGTSRRGICVNITDTGSGIPAAIRQKVFQPFFSTRAEKGTGLGLWVSRGIAQKLNGTIQFRCTKWRDRPMTSFALFIPIEGAEVTPPLPAETV